MVNNFDLALISFEKEQTSFDDESESYGEDNCDDDMSKLCDKIFPKHPRWYAHTLLLVVKDTLGDCSQSLKSILAKAANIVSFLPKSVVGSEMLEDEQRLQAANLARWNSQLQMLKSILKVSESKLNSLDTKCKLSTYDKNTYRNFARSLTLFCMPLCLYNRK